MARYVVANRRAGKFTSDAKTASRHEVSVTLGSLGGFAVVEDNDPADPLARRVTVIEGDAAEIQAKRAEFSADVIVEPEILHHRAAFAPLDVMRAMPLDTMSFAAATGGPVVTVTGAGQPLKNAKVILFLRGPGGEFDVERRTDASGRAAFPTSPPGLTVAVAVVVPAGDHWPMVARGLAALGPIECPPLPQDGPLGWWHRALGIEALDTTLGEGIAVGVADTGLGAHVALAHATRVGSFIDGAVDPRPEATQDVDGHGTHVTGTIGGRPVVAGQYAGMAPAVSLFAARVFPKDRGAGNGDIANAIDELSRERGVDLINMSLGSDTRSEIVADAILDAFERGTLCIAAAGNSSGPVMFPAALPQVVAVSALGLAGWGPPGSLAAGRLPQSADRFGRDNLFLANFSCFGPQIDCAAPGVGVLAPIFDSDGADGFFACMDGTSMASPAACGALAARLSRDPLYRALPRTEARARSARSALQSMLRDVGLAARFQGGGAPVFPVTSAPADKPAKKPARAKPARPRKRSA